MIISTAKKKKKHLKNPTSVHFQNIQHTMPRRDISRSDKSHEKPTGNIILNGKMPNALPL